MAPTVLAIDQGTTSTRAMLFDGSGRPLVTEQAPHRQIFPHNGWVEHDAEEIWDNVLRLSRAVLARPEAVDTVAIGIANQRETTLLWDRETGAVLHNAIVWQDRRGADLCADLHAAGHDPLIAERTGLRLDSYFCASKLSWLLANVADAAARAAAGMLAFGTVESFLVWRLTGGRVHVSDVTNAARTLLFNIHTLDWEDALLGLFGIPRAILPRVVDNAGVIAETDAALFGRPIAIAGMAGDQQAASIGQACLGAGSAKSTYGTGCFVLVNTGAQAPSPTGGLLATVAHRLHGVTSYALEGSIFNAGTAVQWLRDRLGLIEDAAETEALAAGLESNRGVYFVPAFTGLGAPYWDAEARGAILGLTRDHGRAEIVRAALEAVCYQTRDLLEAMAQAGARPRGALRVDGGMVVNDWLLQFLADISGLPVERPEVTETTALGAAYLAGLAVGLLQTADDIEARWVCERRFEPTMCGDDRAPLLAGWADAVARVRSRGAV